MLMQPLAGAIDGSYRGCREKMDTFLGASILPNIYHHLPDVYPVCTPPFTLLTWILTVPCYAAVGRLEAMETNRVSGLTNEISLESREPIADSRKSLRAPPVQIEDCGGEPPTCWVVGMFGTWN